METAADRINLRVTGALLRRRRGRGGRRSKADGRTFRLGDIATVTRGYEDPPTFIVREGGKPALGLGVSMQEGANILTLGEDLEARHGGDHGRAAGRPRGRRRSPTSRASSSTRSREFLDTFVEALAIVLLVSFVSLGWRTGIVVALCRAAGAGDRLHRHDACSASICTASRSAR